MRIATLWLTFTTENNTFLLCGKVLFFFREYVCGLKKFDFISLELYTFQPCLVNLRSKKDF